MADQVDRVDPNILIFEKLPCPRPDVPESSIEIAVNIAETSGSRTSIPLRWSFTQAGAVEDDQERQRSPMARLVGAGGRGAAVSVKLYLALIWRSAAAPHTTDYPARKWAQLLALPEPETKGTRRVIDALRTLEDAKLVRLVREPGEPSIVQILDESGSGAAYELPSTSHFRAQDLASKTRSPERKQKYQQAMEANRYSRIPLTLWTNGHIQDMSSAAVAMLLIVMSNSHASEGAEVWWSTQKFPNQYGISPATRARGTKELVDRGLLRVTKRLVPNSPGNSRALAREKVRNVYTLINDARLQPITAAASAAPTPSVPPVRRRRKARPSSPPGAAARLG